MAAFCRNMKCISKNGSQQLFSQCTDCHCLRIPKWRHSAWIVYKRYEANTLADRRTNLNIATANKLISGQRMCAVFSLQTHRLYLYVTCTGFFSAGGRALYNAGNIAGSVLSKVHCGNYGQIVFLWPQMTLLASNQRLMDYQPRATATFFIRFYIYLIYI